MPTRLQRLAAVVDRARPGRGGRNVRKWMETIGMALIVFGFVCILLGWYGPPTARTCTRRCPTSFRAACSAWRW